MTAAEGTLVTFEGTDGTGKSTLISQVATELDGDVVTVGEFSEGPIGKELRRCLTEDKYMGIDKKGLSIVSMVVADHFYQVENEILPALADGKVALKDRYLETLHACEPRILENDYGFDELGREYIDIVESLTPLVPDLTLYLTLPREEQYDRLRNRGEEVAEADKKVLNERKQVYRRRAEECTERIVAYDNDVSIERATKDIAEIIRKRVS